MWVAGRGRPDRLRGGPYRFHREGHGEGARTRLSGSMDHARGGGSTTPPKPLTPPDRAIFEKGRG